MSSGHPCYHQHLHHHHPWDVLHGVPLCDVQEASRGAQPLKGAPQKTAGRMRWEEVMR